MTALDSLVVALLLLWLALWTVVARDAFVAVAGFVVYGLLLSLVWVRLAGIDVALTEAAIGGGLTGALLLGALGRLRGTEAAARSERSGAGTRAFAVLLSVSVATVLALCVLALPEPAPTLAPQVVHNLPATLQEATGWRTMTGRYAIDIAGEPERHHLGPILSTDYMAAVGLAMGATA